MTQGTIATVADGSGGKASPRQSDLVGPVLASPGLASPSLLAAPGLVAAMAGMPLIVWSLLAVGIVGGVDIWLKLARLGVDYGDLDDALRMVQVRELLAHGRWFDLSLPRMGGADSLLSHWSRLIDLPLALSIRFFSVFVSMPTAELIVRLLWPLLLLAALFHAVARVVDITSGRLAALVVLAVLMTCPSATSQFAVGRIDHHNVQNLAATAAILLLWLIGRVPNAGRWAGVIAGVGSAVGYEALPILMVATAAVSVWGLLDRTAAAEVRSYLSWLAGTLSVAFVATVPMSRWGVMACDVLALNLVAVAVIAAGGVAFALERGASWHAGARWAMAFGAGMTALALGLALEPGCLAGPLGPMTPALTTVWLDQVPEARSWLYFLRTEPHGALAVAVLLAGAVAFLAHRLWRERRAADAFYLAVLVLSLPLAFRFMKYLPYASLLAVPPLAMLIASLPAVKGLSAPTVRLAAFLAGNQLALMMVVLELVPRFGLETVVSHQTTPAGASGTTAAATGATPCFNRDNLAALNTVPPGLIFAPIDLGAHVIADTHHAVLAGPYHRLGPQILETHVILSTPSPADAETRLRRMGARYVLICPAITKLLTPVGPDTNTFDARLRRGEAMPFLEPIALPAGSPFRLWRRIAGGRP